MAKKKKAEDAPKGSPAWMATFSDLMNLLLCFFVLLFSMSSIDAEKYAAERVAEADLIRRQKNAEAEKFEQEKNFIQHGITSTYTHSLCVTYISVWMALRSKKNVDMRSIVRGALLHDYFLYDWHEKNEYHNLHGFTHAKKSLKNACILVLLLIQ